MPLHRLKAFGGEFSCPAREATFQAERLPETVRHTRLIFRIALALNVLFVLSDARFIGSDRFGAILTARSIIVGLTLYGLFALYRTQTFARLQRLVVAWQTLTVVAIAYLCTSRSDIALFMVLMLPGVFMLVVPTRFAWTVAAGAFSSVVLLGAYLLPPPLPPTALGMLMASCVADAAILLFVIRANRLRRLEWAATQAERKAFSDLAESRELFERMFRAVPVPIVVARAGDGQIISTNDAGNRFFGVAQGETLASYRTRDFVAGPDRFRMQRTLDEKGSLRDHETRITTLSGQRRDILLSIETVQVEGTACLISSLVDITTRKAVEEQVRTAAHHDILTGLPNRALFHTTLDSALVRAEAGASEVGLILLDLDAFKEINDTLGHDCGDALLKDVARRLRGAVEPEDLVARLGGDEFVIISQRGGAGQSMAASLHVLAERILDALRPPMPISGRAVLPRASLGLALYPEHADNAADLFTNADLALYAAKASGRNRATLFVPALRANIEDRVRVTREMRAALEEGGGLVPYYQPKIHLGSGAVIGFEALARWQHPTRGLLMPGSFASVFDDPEIGIAVGESLRRQIFCEVTHWIAEGLEPGRVFLNLSSAQFAQGDLAGAFLQDIDAARVPHARIGVEVTETVLLGGHGDRVSEVLATLHGAGIRVALDDFGTGYASLTHLKQYPVDEIKIDRSFIRDLERDANDAAIVTAVLQLGRSLGLDVTAEGVETPEQAAFLSAEGCTHVQGYLYGKPMPASRVPWFLRNRPDLLGGDDEAAPPRRIA